MIVSGMNSKLREREPTACEGGASLTGFFAGDFAFPVKQVTAEGRQARSRLGSCGLPEVIGYPNVANDIQPRHGGSGRALATRRPSVADTNTDYQTGIFSPHEQ